MYTVDILNRDEAARVASNQHQRNTMEKLRGRAYVRRSGNHQGVRSSYFVVFDIALGTALGIIGFTGDFYRADDLPTGRVDAAGWTHPAPYVI